MTRNRFLTPCLVLAAGVCIMKITIKHVFNNQILLTFMNRFIRYYGIVFSIIWMAIYNLLIMPYYEIGDFRLHLFLGVILGLSSNLIEHRAKYLQIALSITIYILIEHYTIGIFSSMIRSLCLLTVI